MPWVRYDLRMPQALRQAIRVTAADTGTKDAEFVRTWAAIGVAWYHALDAVEQGLATEQLRTPEEILRQLLTD